MTDAEIAFVCNSMSSQRKQFVDQDLNRTDAERSLIRTVSCTKFIDVMNSISLEEIILIADDASLNWHTNNHTLYRDGARLIIMAMHSNIVYDVAAALYVRGHIHAFNAFCNVHACRSFSNPNELIAALKRSLKCV